MKAKLQKARKRQTCWQTDRQTQRKRERERERKEEEWREGEDTKTNRSALTNCFCFVVVVVVVLLLLLGAFKGGGGGGVELHNRHDFVFPQVTGTCNCRNLTLTQGAVFGSVPSKIETAAINHH